MGEVFGALHPAARFVSFRLISFRSAAGVSTNTSMSMSMSMSTRVAFRQRDLAQGGRFHGAYQG